MTVSIVYRPSSSMTMMTPEAMAATTTVTAAVVTAEKAMRAAVAVAARQWRRGSGNVAAGGEGMKTSCYPYGN